MAGVQAGLFAGQAGLQVISGIQQADMIRQQTALQQQIDQINTNLAKYNQWRAQADGQTAMARYQTNISQQQGSAKVAEASVGSDGGFGSLADIQEQNTEFGMLNKMDISNQAYEKATGYERQASSLATQGYFTGLQGTMSAHAAMMGTIYKGLGAGARAYTLLKKNSNDSTGYQSAGFDENDFEDVT